MPTTEQVREWRGANLVDRNGDKIGTIDEIYLDSQSKQPEWALVNTGLFGTKSAFVPIGDASRRGDDLQVPVEKAQVKDAPSIDPDGQLSQQEESELYRHYGRDYSQNGDTADRTDGGDGAMTRSEEELRVGTAERESGRVRLRKYVETEDVEQTVPVQPQEVRRHRLHQEDRARPTRESHARARADRGRPSGSVTTTTKGNPVANPVPAGSDVRRHLPVHELRLRARSRLHQAHAALPELREQPVRDPQRRRQRLGSIPRPLTRRLFGYLRSSFVTRLARDSSSRFCAPARAQRTSAHWRHQRPHLRPRRRRRATCLRRLPAYVSLCTTASPLLSLAAVPSRVSGCHAAGTSAAATSSREA